MVKRLAFLAFILSFTFSRSALSQNSYWGSAGEMIFSYGDVNTTTTDLTPVIRWSPVFNGQVQFHHDFNRSVGIFTGLGIRNVGLISHINYSIVDTNLNSFSKEVTVKERSYSLGLPLALKLGNMDKGVYFAAGGEAELMFAYKRKIMDGSNKLKNSGWFNNNVNIFNPSVFAQVNFYKGVYVRFKYYLLDFLNYQGIQLVDGTIIPDYGPKSPLFYVSIGTLDVFKNSNQEAKKPSGTSAYFRERTKHSENSFDESAAFVK